MRASINLLFALLSITSVGFSQTDTLKSNFLNPPDAAKPRTWWHWVASNITKEGITKDLEWMKRVGIGGFHAFDVSLGMGQNVDKKIVFMTPEWLDAIRHTAAEAKRLGLEMTMVTSAGWSETGGPWVKPEEAIKKIVWSETNIQGGKKLSISLPKPPSVNGPIQNLSRPAGFGTVTGAQPDPTYYADQFVIAYPTPKDNLNVPVPKVSTLDGTIEAHLLMDGDLTSGVSVPLPTPKNPVWIQYEYEKPFASRSLSFAADLTGMFGSKDMTTGLVQVSSDGTNYRTILTLPGPQHDIRAIPVRTYTYEEVTGRFYRIVLTGGSGLTTIGEFGSPGYFGPPPNKFLVTEAKFNSEARVHRWEDKAHFAPMFDLEALPTPSVSVNSIIPADAVVDLSSYLSADGVLNWNAPTGNWTILRMGYSLTGSKNGPAVAAGVGFEVDKLNKKHLTSYYEGYTTPIKKALGSLYGTTLQYWLTDSFEADAQNWTNDFATEFKKRRGYELMPYLPVLSGRLVVSPEVSDRFLWDFRRTIADLLADNHYAALAEMAHREGIKLYGESAGISLPIIQDALMNRGRVDIPMSEFGMTQGLGSESASWMSPFDLDQNHAYRGAADRLNAHQADVREAAAAAHVYGKRFVAAESWTGGSFESPASMKLIGDYWNTQGINRFVFHTSTHQPLDTKPGNAMVGTHIHRNITWAEQAGPFVKYLSRNSYLLQQGNFVADLLYYLGEGIPSAVPYWKKLQPEIPPGFDYDFINTELLLDQLHVEDGAIVLPSGGRYRALILPNLREMNLPVLKKIKELVEEGAVVVGPKPLRASSLRGYPAVDREVEWLANEVWGQADGEMIFQQPHGKGFIFWGAPLASVLAQLHVPADVVYTRPHVDTYLSWIHRRAAEVDIYFLSNLRNRAETLEVEFRVSGKVPELWHSDSGEIEPVSYRINGATTTVSLSLAAEESVFVVFREKATQNAQVVPTPDINTLIRLHTGWSITFPEGWGAPTEIRADTLGSWTRFQNEGVKYFSGTATYTNTFVLNKESRLQGQAITLDLGQVRDIAEVIINGKVFEPLWKLPYRLNISEAVKVGTNTIQVKVTNQWTNRIAGDAVHPDKKILSGAGFAFGPPSAAVKESGLLGPVVIQQVKR